MESHADSSKDQIYSSEHRADSRNNRRTSPKSLNHSPYHQTNASKHRRYSPKYQNDTPESQASTPTGCRTESKHQNDSPEHRFDSPLDRGGGPKSRFHSFLRQNRHFPLASRGPTVTEHGKTILLQFSVSLFS